VRADVTNEEAKNIIEVVLFSSDKPISASSISDVLEEIDSRAIRALVEELNSEYKECRRPVSIVEVAGGFQLATDPYYAPWVKKLYKQDRQSRLSMPSLETLAIIAYRQPITRSEIEMIRGVNVDGVVHNLTERFLIRTAGRKDAPGRPILYATTSEFLRHFGINSLDDMPKLKEFAEADIKLGEDTILEAKEGQTDGPEQVA